MGLGAEELDRTPGISPALLRSLHGEECGSHPTHRLIPAVGGNGWVHPGRYLNMFCSLLNRRLPFVIQSVPASLSWVGSDDHVTRLDTQGSARAYPLSIISSGPSGWWCATMDRNRICGVFTSNPSADHDSVLTLRTAGAEPMNVSQSGFVADRLHLPGCSPFSYTRVQYFKRLQQRHLVDEKR